MEQNPGWMLQNAQSFKKFYYKLMLPKPRATDIDNYEFTREAKQVTEKVIHFDNLQQLIKPNRRILKKSPES